MNSTTHQKSLISEGKRYIDLIGQLSTIDSEYSFRVDVMFGTLTYLVTRNALDNSNLPEHVELFKDLNSLEKEKVSQIHLALKKLMTEKDSRSFYYFNKGDLLDSKTLSCFGYGRSDYNNYVAFCVYPGMIDTSNRSKPLVLPGVIVLTPAVTKYEMHMDLLSMIKF